MLRRSPKAVDLLAHQRDTDFLALRAAGNKEMIQEGKNPIAEGDFKWIFAICNYSAMHLGFPQLALLYRRLRG